MNRIERAMRALVRRSILPVRRWVVRVVHTTPYVHGDSNRVHLGRRTSLLDAVLNTASGIIEIEDDVIFGHGCMVLTGRHEFAKGKRKRLSLGTADTPSEGFDIRIGTGTWIASGAIIVGGVTIGEHSIIAGGAVVTHDIPSHSIAAGIPAQVIGSTAEPKSQGPEQG